MKINSKHKNEITGNLETILSYIKTLTDKQIENQAETIISLIKLILDDRFYQQIDIAKQNMNKVKYDSFMDGSFGYTSLAMLKFANETRYKEITDKTKKELLKGVYDVCKAYYLDQSIYRQIIKTYIEKNEFVIPEKIVSLKSSEYRDKVRLIVGKPKLPKLDKVPIYIQLFSDTTQSSVRRFFRENDLTISQITNKTFNYPYKTKFRNIKKEIFCFIYYSLGKSNSEIIKEVSKNYDHKIVLDENNVRNNISKFKKMISVNAKCN